MAEPLTPTNWLWQQLETILTPLQIAELRQGFQAQQRAYNRASQIRQLKREIATFERIIEARGEESDQGRRYGERLARRREKLAKLEEENDGSTHL